MVVTSVSCGIELDMTYAEEFLQTPGRWRDGLSQQCVASRGQITDVGGQLR